MILLVHWHPCMKWTVPQYGRTEGTVRVTENNTVNVTHIYGRWKCRSSRNYCKDIHVTLLLRKFTLLHDQFHGLSPWRHGFTAAWKSGGAAGATHVQISWISAWIPSEVTRTFLAATKQLYEWYFLSVCLSVCLSVRHTFLTMFPSSYHHEIFRSYHYGPG